MQVTAPTITTHITLEDMNDVKIPILINNYYHISQGLLLYMHVYNLRGKILLLFHRLTETVMHQSIFQMLVTILSFAMTVGVLQGKGQGLVVTLHAL